MKNTIKAFAMLVAWNKIMVKIADRTETLMIGELKTVLDEIVASIDVDSMNLPKTVWTEDEWDEFVTETFEWKLIEDPEAEDRLIEQAIDLIYDLRASQYAKEAWADGAWTAAQVWENQAKHYIEDRDFSWIWT